MTTYIPEFKIKLLSGQNVVLVDCPGYESELFMPQIMEERIIFRNIIPNRCCCNAAECPPPLIFRSLKDQTNGSVSLPKATTRVIGGKENRIVSIKGQQPSPQMIRSQLNEQANELREHLIPLYKTENVNFPKPNLECLISQLSTPPDAIDPKKTSVEKKSAKPTTNKQNDSGYNLPVTPVNRELLKSKNTRESLYNKVSPTDNWFKCSTPVHTYSRSTNSGTSTTSGSTEKPAFNTPPARKKLKRSTKPPHPILKLEVHRRKLIIDKKKSLTVAEIKQNDYQTLIKKKNKKSPSAKNHKLIATDILKTSSQSNASNKLKKQFNNALCKKASSTHPVCKHLCEVPPMRMDKQVLHFQRKYGDKKITRPATKKTKTAATTTTAELATVAAAAASASASTAGSSKAMEIIGKPAIIINTSPTPGINFAIAKAKIATLSKTVAAMTAAAEVKKSATL